MQTCHGGFAENGASIGIGAFTKNTELVNVEFEAAKMKVGKGAFAGCTGLSSIDINAAVISAFAFQGCTSLSEVRLGKDVSVIGEYAFANTEIAKFNLASANTYLQAKDGGKYIYKGMELIVAAPKVVGDGIGNTVTLSADTASIATGAFSGNAALFELTATGVTSVGDYAFSDCTNLKKVTLGKLKTIGAYAFANTAITSTPGSFPKRKVSVNMLLRCQKIAKVTLPGGVFADDYAFALNTELKEVEIGDGRGDRRSGVLFPPYG